MASFGLLLHHSTVMGNFQVLLIAQNIIYLQSRLMAAIFIGEEVILDH